VGSRPPSLQIGQDRHDRQAIAQPKLHVVPPKPVSHVCPRLGLDLDVNQDAGAVLLGRDFDQEVKIDGTLPR
jgi:hypothetical protein